MYLLFHYTVVFYLSSIVCGYQTGFEEFIKNTAVKSLLSKYEKKEIKTQAALHQKLEEAGVLLSLCTLKRYLSTIKKTHSAETTNAAGEDIELQITQCYSKNDKKFLYLLGNGNDYRKFVKTNENGDNIYLECLKCRSLYEPGTKRIVASAILRDGILDRSQKIVHNSACSSQPLEELTAQQIDRAARRDIAQCSSDVKSLWREGGNQARENDAAEEIEPDDSTGISYHYPSWSSVRRAYNRRRQKQHNSDSTELFNIPEKLQLNKHGSIKLSLEKPLTANDMWLQYRNKDIGILMFITHTQMQAAKNCRILVGDGTFELRPKGFNQIWSLHGLLETPDGSEWTPLMFAVMKKDAYETLFQQLSQKWGEDVLQRIQRIHADYETAELNAMKNVFGEDKVYGCAVHFIRAVIRQIQTRFPAMFRAFKEKGELYKWVRRCLALPFLRKREIKKMWPVLKSYRNDYDGELREELNSFVVYMTNQWISKIDNGHIFNFNKLSRTRSTNPVESWNSLTKRDPASVRHSALPNVLNFFQQIFAENDERVIKILSGRLKPRPRDKTYEQVDNKIQNTLSEYEEMMDNGEISEDAFGQATNNYLNRLSYLLLQLDEKGTSSRKDQRIRERKRKLQAEDGVLPIHSRLKSSSREKQEKIMRTFLSIESLVEKLVQQPIDHPSKVQGHVRIFLSIE